MFAINTKVTVTGMEVRTQVSNNLLIAPSTTAATAKEADSAFKTNYLIHSYDLLEPVSTVDGVSYFYTNTKNVTANGDASANIYIAYDPDNTSAFNTNAGTTGAIGYKDYAFQLKAVNSSTTDTQYINMTGLELLYNAATTTEKAYRVAVFVNDMGADGSTAATAPTTTSLKSILRVSGAKYFGATATETDDAVSAADTVSAVDAKIDDAVNIGSVAAAQTRFFKVVVRLWLEGEDKTCNNTTFAQLTSDWALNLVIELQNATGGVSNINATTNNYTANLATAAATATDAVVVDGVTYNKVTSVTLNSQALYTTDTTLYKDSVIYTYDSGYLTDVTDHCTLPTTDRPAP